MQKTNQSLVYLEDSRVRINCSISSQTSPDSQHAVLWYVRRATGSEADELLLRIERSGALEYGAYAEEERLRRRVQAERLSSRLYVLTLNRAESSDSGTYYCLVEEWLSDPDGAWYRLSRESSGLTQVQVRQPGERVVRIAVFLNLWGPPEKNGPLGIYFHRRGAAAATFAPRAASLFRPFRRCQPIPRLSHALLQASRPSCSDDFTPVLGRVQLAKYELKSRQFLYAFQSAQSSLCADRHPNAGALPHGCILQSFPSAHTQIFIITNFLRLPFCIYANRR